jgi:hypothetical protein
VETRLTHEADDVAVRTHVHMRNNEAIASIWSGWEGFRKVAVLRASGINALSKSYSILPLQ